MLGRGFPDNPAALQPALIGLSTASPPASRAARVDTGTVQRKTPLLVAAGFCF